MGDLIRQEGHDQTDTSLSAGQAKDASYQREQDRLGENLPSNASRTGTQRGSNRDLLLAAESSRQCKVGHIHAGDEKNKSHGSQQNQQRRAHIADQIVMQGYDCGTPTFVVFWVLLLQPAGDGVHLRLSLLQIDACPEAGNNHGMMLSSARLLLSVQAMGVHICAKSGNWK